MKHKTVTIIEVVALLTIIGLTLMDAQSRYKQVQRQDAKITQLQKTQSELNSTVQDLKPVINDNQKASKTSIDKLNTELTKLNQEVQSLKG